MKERVGSLVGPVAQKMWVSTFHSACARILRREAQVLGMRSSFSIYDQSDSVRLVDYVRRDLDLDPKRFPAPPARRPDLGAEERAGVGRASSPNRATTPHELRLAEVYREYQRRLLDAVRRRLRRPARCSRCSVLREHHEVLERWRHRFHHILVDEFQDTNLAQWELVRLLAEGHRSVMVVGDSDQSVYRFRGADYRNLMRFEEAFPEATIIVLEQNYRSTQRILDAANAVIVNNAARRPKHLWTEQIGGELITRFHAEDEHDEASYIAGEVRRLTDSEGVASPTWRSSIGPTPRAASSRRRWCGRGSRTGSSAACASTTAREVKDALAYLRALVNPDDEVSWRRIVNVPNAASATRR